MADPAPTVAGQPIEVITRAFEQALIKAAAKGGTATLDDLRRLLSAAKSNAVRPVAAPRLLSGKHQSVFEEMLKGATQSEAADSVGVARPTVCRWIKEPEFVEALAAARNDRIDAANEGMADILPLAVRRLHGILMDSGAKHSDVISAATQVMDRAGMPKTSVVESKDTTERDTGSLLDDARTSAGKLYAIPGGKS